MPHIYIRNASKVTIAGMHPGRVFRLETDEAGIPLDMDWQIRLREEAVFKTGHLVPFDPNAEASASPPQPELEPAVQPASDAETQKD